MHSPALPSDERLDAVTRALNAIPNVEQRVLDGVARAVDEIVDPVRSARWSIAELDQPEKTVIGIRVENVLRMELELPRSTRLDMAIAGECVDVKFTIGSNWAIPPEAANEICLVTRFRESDHSVCAGLVRTTEEVLNPGANRDAKRGLNRLGMSRVRWLLERTVADRSIIGFMASIPLDVRSRITDPNVGAQVRLNRLFTELRRRPIPEALVEAVAQHKDWTRRLRPDAANPRAPGHQGTGYDVLRQSSWHDRQRLADSGLPPLLPGFCMSVDPAH